MSHLELFAPERVIGIFCSFRKNGLEFEAEILLPYWDALPQIPLHGQFILMQLRRADEALLGRIVSLRPCGRLSSGSGEDLHLQALQDGQDLPETFLQKNLKYRVTLHILGLLKNPPEGQFMFVPSHRRQPHHGSRIAFPSGEILRELVGHHTDGAIVGHFALGEFIYAAGTHETKVEQWMQVLAPEVQVRFSLHHLIGRRSLVFAKAGLGKSNFNKLCLSELYKQSPTVTKQANRQVPVGTLLFDPDGEYFWPDDKGRPGLCDVPELQEQLVVFTPREAPSAFYASFVADGIKLDLRELDPSLVLSLALGAQKQDQQNVRKLKALKKERWRALINLIDHYRNAAPLEAICTILDLGEKQQAEALAARANMTTLVHLLHDPHSRLMDKLFYALAQGKLCVLDVSLLHDAEALIFSGLILRQIFEHNQIEFTKAHPHSIPAIAVIEEAQSVLTERSSAATPHRDWVKEGRKYDLGSLLITQQPGSIPWEILSQSENWFALHLLSVTDLRTLHRANAHFSQDLLRLLFNEFIPGHAVFWSSVGGKPYPISLRVLSFEQKYSPLDATYERAAVDTFAQILKAQFPPPPEEPWTYGGDGDQVDDLFPTEEWAVMGRGVADEGIG
jgi:hypothetical protein